MSVKQPKTDCSGTKKYRSGGVVALYHDLFTCGHAIAIRERHLGKAGHWSVSNFTKRQVVVLARSLHGRLQGSISRLVTTYQRSRVRCQSNIEG